MNWDPVRDIRTRSGATACGLAYPGGVDCFAVEEIPLYEPCGEGDHLYLTVEKRGIDTPELLRRLAAAAGVDRREIGWAGLKDRHAVARQRVSLPRGAAESRLEALGDEDYAVLDARPHRNKLRVGHLAGNRFRLLLRGRCDPEALAERLREIRERGLPNYFGFQRFGAQRDSHQRGLHLLRRGGRLRGRHARFLLSAYQAALFNRVLDGRLDGLGSLLPGDLAWIHDKGAIFRVEDPAREQARVDAMAISPSGPLPGRRETRPAGPALDIEDRLLHAAGWEEPFRTRLTGGRRPLRVPVGELESEAGPEGLRLAFVLPPGSYASVLLAEMGVPPGGPAGGGEEDDAPPEA
ncbi:MAG: tRNA pseudouridine(13) synthase TruD [Candidatus Krumholzibacteriota bacterium]|nr:tRNA pseudouridine(13) synthase TruD [Candidatus Krumholzibacteriota bacterium]